jgi:hypothetical protein
MLTVGTLFAAILTAALTWWNGPLEAIDADTYSRIQPGFFELHGIVLTASLCFAVAVGVLASAVIRRTVPAMAASIPAFLLSWFGLPRLCSRLLPVHEQLYAVGTTNPRQGLGDWTITDVPFDHSGNLVALRSICPLQQSVPKTEGVKQMQQCFIDQGMQFRDLYHPLSQFWALQGIDGALLLTASIALFSLAGWWTTHRIA